MNPARSALVGLSQWSYERAARPLLFRRSAMESHALALRALAVCDRSALLCAWLSALRRLHTPSVPVQIGGVALPGPFMLAAGFVKGEGFASESEALAAVRAGRNIIPGWRSAPRLFGPIEFGSFTRHPRAGNPGIVMWRDEPTRSIHNRVGLRNPGAEAAAEFLSARRSSLPAVFGLNLAVSPGVTDCSLEVAEVLQALQAFTSRRVLPAWFTLNLSCPNTEDDPGGHQTEDRTRALCQALTAHLSQVERPVPLWVKLSPDLAPEQYRLLMRVLHETGVRAVIATNTLPLPSPDDPTITAGAAGGRLHARALAAARLLQEEQSRLGAAVDVIGCGGVLDGNAFQQYRQAGIRAMQVWSALVFRGPFAAAIIAREARIG